LNAVNKKHEQTMLYSDNLVIFYQYIQNES